MARRRKAPAGYKFTDENHAWYWLPTPHWHVNESDYGDFEGRCFKTEEEAKRVLWRAFQRDYDLEEATQYTHYPKDGIIEITYPEQHHPNEITLSLNYCASPDDCYMVVEE